MNISELKIGQSAEVLAVGGEGNLRQHFLGMGIIPGTVITLHGKAPMGDPLEIMVQGYSLTLRLNEARQIEVKVVESLKDDFSQASPDIAYNLSVHADNSHPGFGEDSLSIFH